MVSALIKVETKRKFEDFEYEDSSNYDYVNAFVINSTNVPYSSNIDDHSNGSFADINILECLTDYTSEHNSVCSVNCISVESLDLEGLYEDGEIEEHDEIGDGRKRNKGSPQRKSYPQTFKICAITLKDSGLGAENISQILGTAKSNIEKWCSKKVTSNRDVVFNPKQCDNNISYF